MPSVRVLVADDHAILRQAICSLLEARLGWQVVGEAANGREAVEKAARFKPDIVLLDINIPEIKSTEATREILKAAPETEVLILSMHESETALREARQAGARGCILKAGAPADLLAAIQAYRKPRTASR
jgi:two-component system, NarL family, response regulator NreC